MMYALCVLIACGGVVAVPACMSHYLRGAGKTDDDTWT